MIPPIGIKVGVGLLSIIGVGVGGYFLIKTNEPTNLGEKLSYDGIVVLSTDADLHDKEWEEIVKKYEGSNNQNKINNLELTTPQEEKPNRSENIKKLKEACKILLITSIEKNENLDSNEKLAKNWCIQGSKGIKTSQLN